MVYKFVDKTLVTLAGPQSWGCRGWNAVHARDDWSVTAPATGRWDHPIWSGLVLSCLVLSCQVGSGLVELVLVRSCWVGSGLVGLGQVWSCPVRLGQVRSGWVGSDLLGLGLVGLGLVLLGLVRLGLALLGWFWSCWVWSGWVWSGQVGSGLVGFQSRCILGQVRLGLVSCGWVGMGLVALWWWWSLYCPVLQGLWGEVQQISHLLHFFFLVPSPPPPPLILFPSQAEILLHSPVPLFRSVLLKMVLCGSASRYECGRAFPGKQHWAHFSDEFLGSTVRPLSLCWIKGVYVFSCNVPIALLARWPVELFFCTCYCGNMGGGIDTRIKVSTESELWRRIFSCCFCQGLAVTVWGDPVWLTRC